MKNKGLLELEEFLLESLIIVFVHCFVHLGEIGALQDCLRAFTACTWFGCWKVAFATLPINSTITLYHGHYSSLLDVSSLWSQKLAVWLVFFLSLAGTWWWKRRLATCRNTLMTSKKSAISSWIDNALWWCTTYVREVYWKLINQNKAIRWIAFVDDLGVLRFGSRSF